MGWVSLSLRKQSLKAEIAEYTFQALQITREKRAMARKLSYEQSIYEKDRQSELRDAKAALDDLRAERKDLDVTDENYARWKEAYDAANVEYQSDKQQIEDYYDDLKTELEQESKDRETLLDEQKDQIETQRDDMQAEYDALKDQVKTQMQNDTLQF